MKLNFPLALYIDWYEKYIYHTNYGVRTSKHTIMALELRPKKKKKKP